MNRRPITATSAEWRGPASGPSTSAPTALGPPSGTRTCSHSPRLPRMRGATVPDPSLEPQSYSYEWWTDDRGNPWVRHQCVDEQIAWRLPPPWRLDGDRITPSLDCQRCGLHTFIGPDEHVARLWNWELPVAILCGSCDGKPEPNPECEWCGGTGIDKELAARG